MTAFPILSDPARDPTGVKLTAEKVGGQHDTRCKMMKALLLSFGSLVRFEG
jgi:hypothetical protein